MRGSHNLPDALIPPPPGTTQKSERGSQTDATRTVSLAGVWCANNHIGLRRRPTSDARLQVHDWRAEAIALRDAAAARCSRSSLHPGERVLASPLVPAHTTTEPFLDERAPVLPQPLGQALPLFRLLLRSGAAAWCRKRARRPQTHRGATTRRCRRRLGPLLGRSRPPPARRAVSPIPKLP